MRNLSELRCWLRDADIKESKGGREEEEEEKRSNFQNMKKEQRKIKQKDVKIRSKSRLKKKKILVWSLTISSNPNSCTNTKISSSANLLGLLL